MGWGWRGAGFGEGGKMESPWKKRRESVSFVHLFTHSFVQQTCAEALLCKDTAEVSSTFFLVREGIGPWRSTGL